MKQSFYFSDAFGLRETWAGLANFTDLFRDPLFVNAMIVTGILVVCISLCTLILGLTLAYLVVHRGKSRWIYKSFLLWPYAVAPAIAALLWRFLCQPSVGWLARGFHALDIDFNYLVHPHQALIIVLFVGIWQQLSYNILFLFVAIKAIPSSLLEAATLDGASALNKFRHIVVPLISPTSFFLLTTNCMYALFDTFGIIDVMTNGGPGKSTTTLMYKIYRDGFVGMDLGSAACQSLILMIIVSLLTLVQFRFVEKKVHYL